MMFKTPIIVGGFYRSGTSLVRRLLDSHSNIHCPSEIKWFKDFYGDYLNDDLKQVRFFETLRVLGLSERKLMMMFGKTYVATRELAAESLGCLRWADKNPENVLYLEHWNELLEGDFIFVHVVRHPMDVLSSLCEIGFPKAVPETIDLKVALMKKYYKAARAFEEENKSRYVCVHYEHMVENPACCLEKLFLSLGEKFEPEVMDKFWWDERVSGIEDPKVKEVKSIHSRSVGRWKNDLTAYQIEVVKNNLSDHMDYFGYCISTLDE